MKPRLFGDLQFLLIRSCRSHSGSNHPRRDLGRDHLTRVAGSCEPRWIGPFHCRSGPLAACCNAVPDQANDSGDHDKRDEAGTFAQAYRIRWFRPEVDASWRINVVHCLASALA